MITNFIVKATQTKKKNCLYCGNKMKILFKFQLLEIIFCDHFSNLFEIIF